MIILEGPDGSGKTTLARRLAAKYKLEYQHEGPPPQDIEPLVYYGSRLQLRRTVPTVFDRFALGECVYGPILRGRDRLGKDGWRVLNRLTKACGAIHVLVTCQDYAVCERAWRENYPVELYKDVTKHRQVWEKYEWFNAFTDVFDVVYDRTSLFPDRVLEGLTARGSTLSPELIGSPTAKVLFVGDRGSSPSSPTTDLAFFGTTDSSGYLTQALDLAGVAEKDVAFMNAYHWKPSFGRNTIPTVIGWPDPRPLHVIALGSAAAAVCCSQKVPHVKIPHPQYWKRFHNKNVIDYADAILNAIHQLETT